jgi:superfamily II DNA or RNA helicase
LRKGFRVEVLGPEPYYGFTLDGDGRYLLGDFTVTHNSGKTVLFSHLATTARARGRRVLIVAHRRELIHQAYSKLLASSLNESEVGVVMASDARRRPAASIQVASIDTRRYRTRPRADLAIIDECHRATAKSYRI